MSVLFRSGSVRYSASIMGLNLPSSHPTVERPRASTCPSSPFSWEKGEYSDMRPVALDETAATMTSGCSASR